MAYLEVKGAIPETGASLNTFCTADAEIFDDLILKKWLFNEFPRDGGSWTELMLTPGVEPGCPGVKISSAEVTITAKIVGMHTFYR